jgi:hypothetical protein
MINYKHEILPSYIKNDFHSLKYYLNSNQYHEHMAHLIHKLTTLTKIIRTNCKKY